MSSSKKLNPTELPTSLEQLSAQAKAVEAANRVLVHDAQVRGTPNVSASTYTNALTSVAQSVGALSSSYESLVNAARGLGSVAPALNNSLASAAQGLGALSSSYNSIINAARGLGASTAVSSQGLGALSSIYNSVDAVQGLRNALTTASTYGGTALPPSYDSLMSGMQGLNKALATASSLTSTARVKDSNLSDLELLISSAAARAQDFAASPPVSGRRDETRESASNQRTTSFKSSKDLGQLVRDARLRMRLSQQQFADLANVGRRFVSELEGGKTTLEIGKVIQVCKAAGVDLYARLR